jgi:hypothetical protein
MSTTKLAFLIQRIGSESSAERRHADRKRDEVIAPACAAEGYELVRADQFSTASLIEPITSALSTATLVVADLGTPPWNQNVLVEVGFRLARGLPIIFVADVDATPEALPIHLQHKRIIHITQDNAQRSIDLLRRYLREQQGKSTAWESDYPLVEFFLPLDGQGTARFIDVNQAAARLYGFTTIDELLSTPLEKADQQLHGYMPDNHRTAFIDDQAVLAAAAVRRDRRNPVTASIPAWIYRGHPIQDQLGHVYWPVLLQHKFAKDDGGLVLRVAFLDVTKWESRVLREREPDSVLKLPGIFRSRPFAYNVFLSYNSSDHAHASALRTVLERMGLRVWMDDPDLPRTEHLTKTLLRSMANSRVILAMIGTQGFGPWQQNIELTTQLQGILKERRPFALVLLAELSRTDNPDLWLDYVPKEFRAAFSDQPRFFLPPLQDLKSRASERLSFHDGIVRVLVEAIETSFEP